MTPYIEHDGKRYEFKATRSALRDIAKLQAQHLDEDGKVANPFGFLDDVAYALLYSRYGLSESDVDAVLDAYNPDNPSEVYELLGAVVDTLFTPPAETETKNTFLAEYRKKKAAEAN